MITLTDLKKRGWTDELIASLLGQPAQIKVNPHYRSGPRMKLYAADRVAEAEKSPAFEEAQKSRAVKVRAAKKAVATKRKRTEDYVDSVEISVPEMDDSELTRRARQHYNERNLEAEVYAGEGDDGAFTARICVNYLRHELTSYEEHLGTVAGKVGARQAYLDVKEKVLNAIADAYPWLSSECLRQWWRMIEDNFNNSF